MWTLRSVIDLPLLSGRLSPSCWPQSVADIDDFTAFKSIRNEHM